MASGGKDEDTTPEMGNSQFEPIFTESTEVVASGNGTGASPVGRRPSRADLMGRFEETPDPGGRGEESTFL